MGAAFFIVLERDIEGVDPFVNGKAIARESDQLDVIASGLGLRAACDFVSQDPADLLEMAEEMGVELPHDPPPEVWYSADEGLDWVSRMTEHLSGNPGAVGDAEAVLADLMEYREVLKAAQSNGVRWHMAVDF